MPLLAFISNIPLPRYRSVFRGMPQLILQNSKFLAILPSDLAVPWKYTVKNYILQYTYIG